MKHDVSIMTELFKLAEDSANETPSNESTRASLAACIVYKKNIVAYGFNRKKTHPFQAKFGRNGDSIYLHAETDAIKNALRRIDLDTLSRSTLYVARMKKPFPSARKLVSGLAKPCEGCAKAIASFSLKRVVWSVDNFCFECN